MRGVHRNSSVGFESGLEKRFLDQCYLQGIKVARCAVVVPYKDSEGKWRSYSPDFELTDFKFVVEVKGSWAFRDNHGWVREKFFAATERFGGRYTLITEKELRKGTFVADLHKRLVDERDGN